MKLWLDDIRPAPEGWDAVAATAVEAIAHLRTGSVTHVSLDHDLAEEHYACDAPGAGAADGTGYEVALFIEQAVAASEIPMPAWKVHSMNPVGRARIVAAMESAERINRLREGGG